MKTISKKMVLALAILMSVAQTAAASDQETTFEVNFDLNDDRSVDCADLELIRLMAVYLVPPSSASDFNQNGILADAGDVTLLRSALEKMGMSCDAEQFHSVAGQVTTASGLPLRNAWVQMKDTKSGEVRYATTSSFGYYSFEGVSHGSQVEISVSSRRYRFETLWIDVSQSIQGADLIALE